MWRLETTYRYNRQVHTVHSKSFKSAARRGTFLALLAYMKCVRTAKARRKVIP
jgi:hypothetical protein